jgi:hypothetical protein
LFQRSSLDGFICQFDSAQWQPSGQDPADLAFTFNVNKDQLYLELNLADQELLAGKAQVLDTFSLDGPATISFDWSVVVNVKSIFAGVDFGTAPIEPNFVDNPEPGFYSGTASRHYDTTGPFDLKFFILAAGTSEPLTYAFGSLSITNFKVTYDQCSVNQTTVQDLSVALLDNVFQQKTLAFNARDMSCSSLPLTKLSFGSATYFDLNLAIETYLITKETTTAYLLQFLLPNDFQGDYLKVDVVTVMSAAGTGTNTFAWNIYTFTSSTGQFPANISPLATSITSAAVINDPIPDGGVRSGVSSICIPNSVASPFAPGQLVVLALTPVTSVFSGTQFGIGALNVSYLSKVPGTLCEP